MKLKKEIVWITVICLLSVLTAKAQAPAWNVTVTANTHTISISNITATDSSNVLLAVNDIIGVFYNNSGVLACAGKLVWGSSNKLIVYGKDTVGSGLTSGDPFRFKIWKQSLNCTIDSVEGVFRVDSISTTSFVSNGISNLLYLRPFYPAAGFLKSTYCDNEGSILPQTSSASSITYSSADYSIDQSTGQINLNGTYAGSMIVKMSSKSCLAKNSQTLTINASPTINLPKSQIVCLTSDTLLSIQQNIEPYISSPKNTLISNISKTSKGNYSITLTNSTCSTKISAPYTFVPQPVLSIEKQELCESVKLTVKNTPGTVQWSTNAPGNAVEITTDSKIWVTYVDNNSCSDMDTIDIKINKLTIDTLSLVETNADCYKPGEVNIQGLNVANSRGNPEVLLKNTLTNEESSTSGFLREGRYQILVKDSRGCTASWKNEFTILKDCLNDNPVFSPNSDAKDDEFYISYEGTVSVYDKNGQLRAKFTGPAYWTGVDQGGNRLPMGIYLLVTGKESKTITILR